MIEIIGDEDAREFAVAVRLKEAFEEKWNGISETDPEQENIKIYVGAKLSGYRVGDIDLIVCGKLREGRRIKLSRQLRGPQNELVSGTLRPSSFCIAIEVKDHDSSGIKFEGETTYVRYKGKWHNASDQNDSQAHTLKSYFKDLNIDAWVYKVIILNGLESTSINGVLPAQFSCNRFFTELASLKALFKPSGSKDFIFNSFKDDQIEKALSCPLFRRIVPTSLDRKRMDRLAGRTYRQQEWFNDFGNKQLIFRGYGGTGKTALLLQAAYGAYDEKGLRTLFLTYNRALTADITRLMALMKIPSGFERGGIDVRTVMSFVYKWLSELGVVSDKDEYTFDLYEEKCEEALSLIQTGAVNEDDIIALKNKHPDLFDYDLIVIDEGQDWPQQEADLIKTLYKPQNLTIADGVDQLVRGKRTDWIKGVPNDSRSVVKLKRGLRMKANLAHFSNSIAKSIDLKWFAKPNNEAGGGRIILLTEPYSISSDLHSDLIQSAKDKGNDKIDFLFCLNTASDSFPEHTDLAMQLENKGEKFWDGRDENVRKDFVRDKDTFRLVNYASCRGLEGWTVIADNIDHFWQSKYDLGLRNFDGDSDYSNAEEFAASYAWNWCLIPMTRAIDTMVISISDKNSIFSKAILSIQNEFEDYLEIY